MATLWQSIGKPCTSSCLPRSSLAPRHGHWRYIYLMDNPPNSPWFRFCVPNSELCFLACECTASSRPHFHQVVQKWSSRQSSQGLRGIPAFSGGNIAALSCSSLAAPKPKSSKSAILMAYTWNVQAEGDVWVHYPEGTWNWQQVKDRPVWCSLAEAQAYCSFKGGRVMTEAEYSRAVDVDPHGNRYLS